MTTKKNLFLALLILFTLNIVSFGSDAKTEPFDRIVLKDMTVVKASLVKDLGDSLAYFELNDTEFVRHTVGRDQVFKWVRAVSQNVSSDKIQPAPNAVNIERTTAPGSQNKPQAIINDSLKNDIPVVDYQTAILNAVKDSEIIQPPAASNTSVNDLSEKETADSGNLNLQKKLHQETGVTKDAAPESAFTTISENYDTGNAVPQGLSRVRLDPPTKTDGVKIIPRSGMLAINPSISWGSLGLGLRKWSASGFGFGAKGEWLWGSESGFLINGELMQAFNSQGRCRWYGFGKIGYEWVTMTTPSISVSNLYLPGSKTNLSFANFILGIGLEWRTGINRNHGWSAELGYQYGQADYTYKSYTYNINTNSFTESEKPTKDSYKLSPVYIGISYSYYF